jgi:hypothetical protein
MAAYLTSTDADTLAATLPGLSAYKAVTGSNAAAVKTAALLQASDDIDQAIKYQGCEYGPLIGQDQPREFPRATDPASLATMGFPSPDPLPSLGFALANKIWDWDATTSTAVVPAKVQLACLHQADSILKGDRDGRLQSLADGMTQQGIGTMSEQYQNGSDASVLCMRAKMIMDNYRLRSGRML